MPTKKQGVDWSKSAVVKRLGKSDKTVRAQVFLSDDLEGDFAHAVERLVKTAKDKSGSKSPGPAIGKLHRLAKSFSIEATPDVLEAIAGEPTVKSILPSEVEDIYPKPVRIQPV